MDHDALETMQQILGYRDMTIARTGALMWLLRVPPLDATPAPRQRSGIVVFQRTQENVSMVFVPAGGAR